MLTFDELAARLQISRSQVTALVREGLPFVQKGRAKRFDPQAVRQWLLARGKAVAEAPDPTNAGEQIARTRGEAARLLGVNLRTLADWLLDPTFPGKPGHPGRQDGYFPIEAIADWCARRQGLAAASGSAGDSPRERLLRIRIEQEQLELDQRRGRLVDALEVERLLRRTIATTRAVLAPLAEELLLDLPAEVPEEVRQQLRRRIAARLESAFENIANLLSGDDEPPDEE